MCPDRNFLIKMKKNYETLQRINCRIYEDLHQTSTPTQMTKDLAGTPKLLQNTLNKLLKIMRKIRIIYQY